MKNTYFEKKKNRKKECPVKLIYTLVVINVKCLILSTAAGLQGAPINIFEGPLKKFMMFMGGHIKII